MLYVFSHHHCLFCSNNSLNLPDNMYIQLLHEVSFLSVVTLYSKYLFYPHNQEYTF
ncbi:MAG: hypothetical protein HFF37_01235 [Coprobacillus sp.]|nr:hypothetical protein [Coprobacillus sp.]